MPLDRQTKSGSNTGLFAGEKAAGATESYRDFVGDEVHAMAIAQGSGVAQKARVVHRHSASCLNQRFDDQGCRLRVLCGEISLQRACRTNSDIFGTFPGTRIAPIRRGKLGALSQKRRIRIAK